MNNDQLDYLATLERMLETNFSLRCQKAKRPYLFDALKEGPLLQQDLSKNPYFILKETTYYK